MTQILYAFLLAFRNLLHPKILWLFIWPLIAACLLWTGISYFFWIPSADWIREMISSTAISNWLGEFYLEKAITGIEGFLNVVIFIMLVVVTTLVITALFAMPALINFVAKRYFPQLDRQSGGTIMGSLVNVISATLVFIVLWGIALPFWFIGIGMIISFVAAAYLNQRVFSYDALAEHANPEELKTLLKTDKLMLWGLGLLTGVLQFVPILNFFAPTITALAFIHFELTRLKKLRAQSNQLPQIG
ncbi:MAG TPA: EI24 domain-containing protein [Nitrosomonas nitrosa]|uniref:Etoposide-induced protein 2.4 (EI24) n=1 Tax=Nitrosomonas nitrosa TaxID=52442 RepID=A0A1I4TSN3_9PROT|nr:EI24 domain-containing protein [Nitrosomonas nitrosa]SFM79734.1 Etoposide-induced protein 2.4 (EI24) [Nitrosomonas nitrosa]HNP52687.1 EI24 domain-containing protein [Nitrosomonas nitrosa]